jgi:hypothetical protein
MGHRDLCSLVPPFLDHAEGRRNSRKHFVVWGFIHSKGTYPQVCFRLTCMRLYVNVASNTFYSTAYQASWSERFGPLLIIAAMSLLWAWIRDNSSRTSRSKKSLCTMYVCLLLLGNEICPVVQAFNTAAWPYRIKSSGCCTRPLNRSPLRNSKLHVFSSPGTMRHPFMCKIKAMDEARLHEIGIEDLEKMLPESLRCAPRTITYSRKVFIPLTRLCR